VLDMLQVVIVHIWAESIPIIAERRDAPDASDDTGNETAAFE